MQFYTRKRRNLFVNVVSLIDILAILLIFFIVSTTFRKKQPQVQINLPESKAAESAPAPTTEPVVLRVKNGDQISLDDKPVSLDKLAAAIQASREAHPKRGIALQADREAPFGVVVKVLDALKQAGIQDVPAFTQPEPGKP
jgi:biopolymer transport protein ExbD